MSQISSINFKKSNAIQATHNDRTLAPSYLISDSGCECNRNAEQAKKLKKQIIENAKEAYATSCKARNKAFQAKSYEWSAVCNIKEDTTMQDLERLAEHFEQKYGFQCYQIAIHRDEGHFDDNGEKVINHHAHLEFVTLDKETGKNCFKLRDFPKSKMREIQDEVAEILDMERGLDKRLSGVERVEPRKYAQLKEQERKNTQKLKQDIKTKDNVIQDLNQELEQEKLSKAELKKELETWFQNLVEKHTKKGILSNKVDNEAIFEEMYKVYQEPYKKIQDLEAKLKYSKAENTELKNEKERFQELLEQDLALKKAYNQALKNLENRKKENMLDKKRQWLEIKERQERILDKRLEQDQENDYDELGIDKILIHKNEEETQEHNKPKIHKYR